MAMRFFIFKSEARSELRAFAADPGGQQLPAKFGPWHAVGVVRADKAPPHNLNRDVIEQAITKEGFQLFRTKPKKAATG
jgi:hypothetical protein